MCVTDLSLPGSSSDDAATTVNGIVASGGIALLK
jgi:hypothetical protein